MHSQQIPASLEAERALLGLILLDDSTLRAIDGEIRADDFFLAAHRIIFEHMQAVASTSGVDLVTLIDQLRRKDLLERVGGGAYVSSLTDGVPIGCHNPAREYCRIVREAAKKREAINLAENIIACASNGAGLDELATRAHSMAEIFKPTKTEEPEIIQLAGGRCPEVQEGAWYKYAAMYRAAVGETTEAPDSYHLACFLTVVGAALGRTVHTRLAGNELLYPNLFTVLVGNSADARKGTAMNIAKRFAKKMADTNVQFIASIDSAEGLIKSLADYQKNSFVPVIAKFSEVRSLLDKAAKEGTRNIVPILCTAYDCEELENRTSKERLCLPESFLALLGGSSIEYLMSLKKDDVKGGLGSRFMFVAGTEKPRKAKPPGVMQPLYDDLAAQLRTKIELWRSRKSTEILWSPAADQLWIPLYEEELPRRAGSDPIISSVLRRFHHHIAKIAIIFAALDDSSRIEPHHLGAAICWGDFLSHSAYYIFSNFGVPYWVEQEQKIVEAVRGTGPGGIRRRALQQRFPRMGAEDFNRRMNFLTKPESQLREEKRGRQIWITLAKD